MARAEVASSIYCLPPMRTLNYIFSVVSIVLGIALILFMLIQSPAFSIGVAIGIVLVLNGAVRLWFAQDDHK